VIDQPHSNGIWYDVGNVDGRFLDNWVQGAQDGFFFEISKGAVVVGNVFVNCDKGIRVLNSSNVHAYHNTLLNTVASFERTERNATNDHFGWHPSTGPDVDKREGHVFVGNLLVGDATFPKELLRFEQVKVLCGKLTRPQATRIDGNVYVREAGAHARTLVVWSPADGPDCTAEYPTLVDFQRAQSTFDAKSHYFGDYFGSVFQSSDLGNLRPVRAFRSDATVPAEVRQFAGWPADVPLSAGAYATTK
jgi:parallel beta-helix repeat protein